MGWLITHGPARKALGLILAAAAILLFLLNLRHTGERAGRAAERLDALGSRLIDRQSQNMTVAARATAERKTFGHLS